MPSGLSGLLARARASTRVGIGVALGPTSIQVAVVERAGPRVRLLAVQETPCDTSQAEPLTRALAELRQRLRLTGPVVLGVPSTSAILTVVQPLIVTPSRAALAVAFELQQQLPFELADAAWHYHWLSNGAGRVRRAAPDARSPAASPPGSASRVVAAAMRRSLLEERLSACRRAGLAVRAVGVNAVAALNVAHLAQPPSSGGTTAVLTLVDPQQAEWSVAGPERLQVVPVTSPSPDALWEHVAASWQALRAEGVEAAPPVRLVGPPEALAPAQQALAGVAVELIDIAKAVSVGTSRSDGSSRAAVALGLALQGLGAVSLPLNLLDGAQRDAQARVVRRASLITSGACLALTVLVGASGMLEVRARRASVQRALEQRERLYQTLRPEIRALIQRQQRTEGRSLQLEQLAADSPALTQVLALIAEAMPREVWLTALDGSKDAARVQGLLEGRATSFQDVTKFLEQLKSRAGMSTVKPLSTNVITDEALGKEVIAFSVQVERPLHPEAGP